MSRVLVIDSGVGGLSVVQAIRAALPALRLVYLADNAWFPYGTRPVAALVEHVVTLVEQALRRAPCDALVVACNTASTVALDALRARLTLPVVGVVPPIKTAGTVSRSRVVGLLATEATVTRPYVRRLEADFAPDCRIVALGSSRLAEMAEAKLRGVPVDRDELRALLAPFFGADAPPIDTVVLGCTHYPLLLDELVAVSPPEVRWLDASPAIARRLVQVLAARAPHAPADESEAVYFTAPPTAAETLTAFLAALHLPAPQLFAQRETA